jgi:hypothetical protein
MDRKLNSDEETRHKKIEANMCLVYDLEVIHGGIGFYLWKWRINWW